MVNVFKTSVETNLDIEELRPDLDKEESIIRWNFDLEDCDNILRVEGSKNSSKIIRELFKHHNFKCYELE